MSYDQISILETTGPGVFTDAVLDALSEFLPSTHPLVVASVEADRGVGELNVSEFSGDAQSRVTWAPFYRLREPVWVDASEGVENGNGNRGGLGILPINTWGNGQRHSGAEGFSSVHACVNHGFQGSWRKWWWQRLFD